MNRQETGIIMDILSTAYPRFYSGPDMPNPEHIMNLWAELFAEEAVEIVAAAVKALIAGDEKGYPPHIGAVKARIRQITRPQELTDGEAWALVAKAIRNSGYDSGAEFDRLPESVRRIVGTPSQLRDWATMDSGTVHSVVASNFRSAYRSLQDRRKLYDALPADVRALARRIAGERSMETLPEKTEAGHGSDGD